MRVSALLLGLILSSPAWAWKIDTHLWLADELHKEIAATGEVPLGRLGRVAVPPVVRDSIVQYRGAFLLGVLGPDLYPDMVSGQMTTHPGLPLEFHPRDLPAPVKTTLALLNRTSEQSAGWQTDDWLAWVRNRAFAVSGGKASSELAMAYGYLLHAAMDVWAHTYVNLYAGDVFEILSNQEVSARHVAIESYVKAVHQSLLDKQSTLSQSKAGGELTGVIRQPGRLAATKPSDALAGLRGPAAFVRRTLILNPEVADQYARVPATTHVWAMYIYWSEVGRLVQGLQPLKSSVNDAFTGAAAALQQARHVLDLADQAYDAAREAADEAYGALQQAEQTLLQAENDFNEAAEGLLAVVTEITDAVLAAAPPPLRQAYQQAKQALDTARSARNTARTTYQNLLAARDQHQQALTDAASQVEIRQGAHAGLNLIRQQTVPAIDAAVVQWRRNIEAAVDAYIVAWEETAKEIMRPRTERFTPGGNPTEPLRHWVTCWGPTFGISPAALPAGCEEGLAQYSTARTRLDQLLSNALLDAALRDAVEDFEQQMHVVGAELLTQVAGMMSNAIRVDNGVIAGSASFAVQMWDKEVTPEDLAAEFRNDPSGKRLYVYQGEESVLDFISEDMGVPPGSHGLTLAQLSSFAALQNSMTMAGLTLLDGRQLNELAQKRRITRTVYSSPPNGSRLRAGEPLYPAKALPGEVLIGALRSIDGNHQWRESAPKLPRNPPGADQPSVTCLRYGYPLEGYRLECSGDAGPPPGKGGLRLWQDPAVREAVFKAAFRGPVAPALCRRIGRKHLGQGIGCIEDPFPDLEGSTAIRELRPATGRLQRTR